MASSALLGAIAVLVQFQNSSPQYSTVSDFCSAIDEERLGAPTTVTLKCSMIWFLFSVFLFLLSSCL